MNTVDEACVHALVGLYVFHCDHAGIHQAAFTLPSYQLRPSANNDSIERTVTKAINMSLRTFYTKPSPGVRMQPGDYHSALLHAMSVFCFFNSPFFLGMGIAIL